MESNVVYIGTRSCKLFDRQFSGSWFGAFFLIICIEQRSSAQNSFRMSNFGQHTCLHMAYRSLECQCQWLSKWPWGGPRSRTRGQGNHLLKLTKLCCQVFRICQAKKDLRGFSACPLAGEQIALRSHYLDSTYNYWSHVQHWGGHDSINEMLHQNPEMRKNHCGLLFRCRDKQMLLIWKIGVTLINGHDMPACKNINQKCSQEEEIAFILNDLQP